MVKFRHMVATVALGLMASNAFAAYVSAAFPKETVEKTASLQKNATTFKDIIQPNHPKIPPIQ